jgi:3-methyladenine DNA glycosylase/8-oxoguanine DNA glycosylase
VKRLYGLAELPTEDEVEAIGKKWHPYCTIASIYLWRLTETKEDAGA